MTLVFWALSGCLFGFGCFMCGFGVLGACLFLGGFSGFVILCLRGACLLFGYLFWTVLLLTCGVWCNTVDCWF